MFVKNVSSTVVGSVGSSNENCGASVVIGLDTCAATLCLPSTAGATIAIDVNSPSIPLNIGVGYELAAVITNVGRDGDVERWINEKISSFGDSSRVAIGATCYKSTIIAIRDVGCGVGVGAAIHCVDVVNEC